MTDRSNELTESRDGHSRSTDDILEETERMLSGADVGDAGPDDRSGESVDRSTADRPPVEDESAASRGSRFRLPSLRPTRSLGEYFSPKGFLALVLLAGVGLFAGQTVLPIGGVGRFVGLFAVAFAVGLVTSKRRYLEFSAAGVSTGVATTLLFEFPLAVAGSARALVAMGAVAGLVAALAGYYFGRDLRDGLVRDVT
ncbi:DUF456 domain-containing protein [Natrarchaeobius oligotrophus]|uniref:DUF456 domain-containing protein n=1 Tax=Natrarchaeobius chitinivorans TaxID=1679083 RepID=A0A3N6MRD5_NATCH|nr:DUF456 domain-containing protein [Natrarchaeobius chitinivorans]RQG98831.1 DUF456 domain-containing protein [Natrarchaeobius chitinivorans]